MYSLFLRINRYCPWNKCTFCPIYKGQTFSRRTKQEVMQDLDAMKTINDSIHGVEVKDGKILIHMDDPGITTQHNLANIANWLIGSKGEHMFLQDGNAIQMKTEDLAEIIKKAKEYFPTINRITTYGRARTIAKKTVKELTQLKEAGLTRVHIGLETGYDPLLDYVKKGATAVEQIDAGQKVKQAGLSLSEYVMPGLGGKRWTREHATETAEVLNHINPDFIRLRTLSITPHMLLYEKVKQGEFELLSEEETVEEIKLFIETLDGITSTIVSDHILNLLQEVHGKLPDDREKMLNTLNRFLSLPEQEKINFIVGSRLRGFGKGYFYLDDMQDKDLHDHVEAAVQRLGQKGDVEAALQNLKQSFI